MKFINVILAILFSTQFLYSQDPIKGDWEGKLSVSGIELRLVFHITNENGYGGTMDSPDQGAYGIALGEITLSDQKVSVKVPSIGGSYDGTVVNDSTMEGTWSQGPAQLALSLSKKKEGEVSSAPRRPQEPKPPYPYQEEEVNIKNEKAGVTLAGTLTIPEGDGPFPAAILVSGSGPQNRNEELLGHKPFLVLSDYLTRQGIAVLRYDDRGMGESTGNFANATSNDFADDAQTMLSWLQKHPKIIPDKSGIIGHSEGGLIGPMVAKSFSQTGFLVLMAGPGINGEEILKLQTALIAKANGADKKEIEKTLTFNSRAFSIVKNEENVSEAKKQLDSMINEYLSGLSEEDRSLPENDSATLIVAMERVNTNWFRYFLSYEPSSSLEKVKCPVLAINGEKDLQVPPKENLAAIESSLKKAGNTNYKIKEFEGLNHLFQHSETGAPSEYATIEETFSEEVMKLIADWINDL